MIRDISVIILTKNEELHIERAIKSVGEFANKIIVIDSFSSDSTKEICNRLKESLNIEFYERSFKSHHDQFNWGLENTNINTSWVLRLDADEYVSENLKQSINEKINLCDNSVNGFSVNRKIIFLGKWIKFGGVYPQRVLRIIRKGKGYCEEKDMDEHLVVKEGTVAHLDFDIVDENLNNLTWWIDKHNWYSNKEKNSYYRNTNKAESKLDKAAASTRWLKNNLYYKCPIFLRAFMFFLYRYIFKLGFLDGKMGYLFHFLQGFWYRTLVDAKILEEENKNS